VAVLLGFSWLLFFGWKSRQMNFRLGFAFRLLFFLTGMLPVILLFLSGFRLIEQRHEADIVHRTEQKFAALDSLNEKTQALSSFFGLLLKDILGQPELLKKLHSPDHNINKSAFADISARLAKRNYDLSYILHITPGQIPYYFAGTAETSALARYHLDYYALSCQSLHKSFIRNQPAAKMVTLSPTQKTLEKAFSGTTDESAQVIFDGAINTVSSFEGSNTAKHLLFAFILTENEKIATYLVVCLNLGRTIRDMIRNELSFIADDIDSNYAFLSRNQADDQEVLSEQQEKFAGSQKGKRLHAFLEAAANSRFRMQIRDDNDIYIYEPLLKVKHFLAGACISIADLKAARDLKLVLLMLLITVLAGAIYLLTATISRLIIEPTEELASFFDAVADGNLEQKFIYPYSNELGLLAGATTSMVQGLKQRKLLGKFVSRTFDEKVYEQTSQKSSQQLNGVVLFSDIRSFTTISESNPPEAIGLMLNAHLKSMVEIINQHAGQVEQFIGDAIVAFFPGNGEVSCQNAIRAAAAMMSQHFCNQQNATGQCRIQFSIGIGMEYGLVMAGIIQSSKRSEYIIIGPARVRAEKLESSSKSGRFSRIIIGHQMLNQMPAIASLFVKHSEDSFELQNPEGLP
jgi:class 3 adenylate cyclase